MCCTAFNLFPAVLCALQGSFQSGRSAAQQGNMEAAHVLYI
jgi:hypothetical protein